MRAHMREQDARSVWSTLGLGLFPFVRLREVLLHRLLAWTYRTRSRGLCNLCGNKKFQSWGDFGEFEVRRFRAVKALARGFRTHYPRKPWQSENQPVLFRTGGQCWLRARLQGCRFEIGPLAFLGGRRPPFSCCSVALIRVTRDFPRLLCFSFPSCVPLDLGFARSITCEGVLSAPSGTCR